MESRLVNGLLLEGQLREVLCDTYEMDNPVSVETFTVADAAKALGRTEVTFRKWIAEEMIPGPILRDAARDRRLYSSGELQVIANILREHEREFAYYTAGHERTREEIFQMIQGYRALYI